MNAFSSAETELCRRFCIKPCNVRLKRLKTAACIGPCDMVELPSQDVSSVCTSRQWVSTASQSDYQQPDSTTCGRFRKGPELLSSRLSLLWRAVVGGGNRQASSPERQSPYRVDPQVQGTAREHHQSPLVDADLSEEEIADDPPLTGSASRSNYSADCDFALSTNGAKDGESRQESRQTVVVSIPSKLARGPEERLFHGEKSLLAYKLRDKQVRLQIVREDRAQAQRAARRLEQDFNRCCETLALKDSQADGLKRQMEDLIIRKAKIECDIVQLREKLVTIAGQELPPLRERITARFAEEERLQNEIVYLRQRKDLLQKCSRQLNFD